MFVIGTLSSDIDEERPCGELVAESPPRRMKTISSAVVAEALEKLRGSKNDLMDALAEVGGPSNLNVTSIVQHENDVADPAASVKLNLMERRTTAETYEVEFVHVYCFHQIIYDIIVFQVSLCLNSKYDGTPKSH